MYTIYKSQALTGIIRAAVIILCTGKEDTVRFAEYHILLPSRQFGCKRFSQRVLTEASDELMGIALSDLVLSYATDKIQEYADEQASTKSLVAPAIVVTQSSGSALRALWYSENYEKEFNAIAAETLCRELKDVIRALNYLPRVSPTQLA